ncbi:hypothetical protein ABN763_04355 [Spongiivirga sp. MCCC 1A20706]|uniref:hypothetical protein n=1 Tax=Spongiivirga sp. MCCC 1A20706 TaxID=3160963 RepID=UPI003977B81B
MAEKLKRKKAKIKELDRALKQSTKILPVIVGIFASLLGVISTYQEINKKNETQNIGTQIENLDDISKDLKNLQTFVESQKKKLISENEALENLKKEKENLKPIIEADKKILEAVFLEQEKRQRKEVWYERAFGFFIGILSSLVASLIFIWIGRKRKVKNEKDSE